MRTLHGFRRLRLACLLLLALPCLGLPEAARADEPGAAALVEALLRPEGPERRAAEERLASAGPDVLREVIAALRARLAPDGPALGLDPSAAAPVAAEPPPGTPVIHLEAAVIRASACTAQALLRASTPEPGGGRSFTPQAFEAWRAACARARGCEVLAAPRLSVYEAQAATISVLRQVAYVHDVAVQRSETALIADPVVQTVSEGVLLHATARRLGAGLHVTARLELAELLLPIERFTTTLAAGTTPVTIQLPRLVRGGADRALALTPGRPTLLADLASPASRDGRRVLVFLTARLEPPAAAAPAAPPAR